MKMKNRTLIGIVCIVLAVAVTFLVSPLVNRISEQKTDVIRFTKDISHGSKIAETDIEIVKLSKNSVPEKALKTKDAVVGKYAKADLFKGDLATEIKITDDENSVANVFSSLNGDKVAMSVTINTFAGGLSGKLENGDIVSVYVTDKEGETKVPSELKYVKVITTTTSGGVDETEVVENEDGSFEAKSKWTEIFIYPGYSFKAMDGLITNFHLPESTLVMLVSAFAGREHVLDAYAEAVRERYRFFSFGDAMLIC